VNAPALLPPAATQLAASFSPIVLKGLASSHLGDAAGRIARVAQFAPHSHASLGESFCALHNALFNSHRSEYVFKNQIVSKIVFGRHSPRTASALLELPMGQSVADVVILNGTTTVYEVKTDFDRFDRLATQLDDYADHVEHVNVVVSEKRAAAAERSIQPDIGILALRRSGALSVVRESSSNMPRLSTRRLYLMLRTGEAIDLLGRTTGYEPDVPSGHLWLRMRTLFEELPIQQAHREVISQLRKRGTSAAKLVSDDSFPPSMRALAYSSELSGAGVRRVRQRLATSASTFLRP
jgi:hypothetical protein